MRLLVFGGSFDPIHLGHLHAAEHAARLTDANETLFLPAHCPPHKKSGQLLTAADRIQLIQLAIQGNSHQRVDSLELGEDTSPYTYDTLSTIAARQDEPCDLLFLIGGDSLLDLPKWHRSGELATDFTLVTVPRDPECSSETLLRGVRDFFPDSIVAKLERNILAISPLPISSTEIRRRIREGEPIDNMVPPAVKEAIDRNGFYR